MIDETKIMEYRDSIIQKVSEQGYADDEELMQNIAWAFSTAIFSSSAEHLSTDATIALCRERVTAYTDNYYGDHIDID